MAHKPFTDLVASDFETRGKSDVRVESGQRFVSQLLRQGMQSADRGVGLVARQGKKI